MINCLLRGCWCDYCTMYQNNNINANNQCGADPSSDLASLGHLPPGEGKIGAGNTYNSQSSILLHTCGAPGSSRPTIRRSQYKQHIYNIMQTPTAYKRNAEDSVPYRTCINHITLYKWWVPCRGQAPGPQASPRGTGKPPAHMGALEPYGIVLVVGAMPGASPRGTGKPPGRRRAPGAQCCGGSI